MIFPFDFFFLILHIRAEGSFPRPLTAEEERKCVEEMKQGSVTARNKLIEHNLRLVAHIVKKYYATPEEQDDLVSIGTIGLIKAVDSFKCDKNIKLATYAARCIENEILMHFRALKKTAGDVSINDEIDTDKDGNPLELIDVLAQEDDMLDDIWSRMRVQKVRKAVFGTLDGREREIICLRYGLTEPSMTQHEIAKRLGISRSYVSRIEKKALEKLKDAMQTP